MTQNALHPTQAQLTAVQAQDDNAPVYMLNLLKFKERATYTDGQGMSGREAYERYAKGFTEIMTPHGVTSIYGGAILSTLIGTHAPNEAGSDWDMVALVMYPSAAKMVELTSSKAYRKIHYHRKAGLDGQILLACNADGVFS
ncbi:MAG: DUF1330 domain-containing protein [Litorimonas sp.]